MTDLFGDVPPDIDAQIREVKRELGQRAHVYPRLISGGRLTKANADRQTRSMQAALETLERVKAAEA